jgi:hypothetical protein
MCIWIMYDFGCSIVLRDFFLNSRFEWMDKFRWNIEYEESSKYLVLRIKQPTSCPHSSKSFL